jgi:hypothetical protein
MTGKTKTTLALSTYFATSELPFILSAISGKSTWGTPISMGLLIGALALLASRKKTWARHLILIHLGFSSFFLFSATFDHPSVFLYGALALSAFLFWALCWHKPILEHLEIIPAPSHLQKL